MSISKSKKQISKTNDIRMDKIGVFFKRSILTSILKILTMEHSGFRNFKALKNINKLFSNLDLSKYKNSKELESYIWCIKFISKEWIDGLVDINLILEKAKREDDYDNIKDTLITTCLNDTNIITSPEVKMIYSLIAEALQFGYVSSMKEEYLSLLDDIDLNEPASFKELANRLFLISQSLMDIKHNTNLVSNKITFNTADTDSIKESVSQTISSLSASSNVFKVGIRRLNTLLSPGYMNGRIYVYLASPGGGKAVPNDTPIPTPNGFKRMDELKLDDEVFNLYGKPVKVIGIYPQGIQETYKVTLSDGRSAKCNAEHLWYTLDWNDKTEAYDEVVRKLSDMISDYKHPCKYLIPNNGVAQFKEREVPLDPWMMGFIIGSCGMYSNEKRIPKNYIFNTEDIRMKLLHGLIDSSNSNNHIKLSTTSSELVQDIGTLLESLGIRYSIQNQYEINIEFNNRDMYEPLRITNIEKVEDSEQRCITVDDPLHVYLTEQFIPTHNSMLLLKSALDIRKYNPNFKTKTPGMKPCVLYITMENSFTETIERVWNMNYEDSITNYTKEEASEMICKELGVSGIKDKKLDGSLNDLLVSQDDPNIEVVIKYFPYRDISTDDLFTIIQDLRDENLEVCALVLDYIKRIRPITPVPDNVKLELDRVMNELKALAVMKDIPVITAHQMNRAAASTVDSAVRQGRGDVTKLVGREHVGSAYEIIEVADFAAVLNIEYKPGTDDRYMVISVIKRRRIDISDIEFVKYTYLAHPFHKNKPLALIDDVNLDKVLSVQSLVNDIDIIGKERTNAVPRLKSMEPSEFEEFDEEF